MQLFQGRHMGRAVWYLIASQVRSKIQATLALRQIGNHLLGEVYSYGGG